MHVDQALCYCTFCLCLSICCCWCCHCCFLLFSSRCVLLYLYVRSGIVCCSPGLSNQDCLLRYHVKINSTCTRCDCIVTQHLLYSGQLSQSLDPRALQNVILYTSGITILYIHMYFNMSICLSIYLSIYLPCLMATSGV